MSLTQSHLELLYEPDQNIFFITDGLGNIGDLNVDMEKELEVCRVVSDLVEEDIFQKIDIKFPEIYKLIIEKAYECEEDYHRLNRFDMQLKKKTKKYLIAAFNEFIHEKFVQKFGQSVTVEYF